MLWMILWMAALLWAPPAFAQDAVEEEVAHLRSEIAKLRLKMIEDDKGLKFDVEGHYAVRLASFSNLFSEGGKGARRWHIGG